MSPEQAAGKRTVVDHRTDIYSLGVTLYELLTLKPALDGHDRQSLLRQLDTAEPTPPRKIDAGIPADLETIVLKSIAKDRDLRYSSAQELADDLRRFLDHKPVRARRITTVQVASSWARRNPWVASLGTVAFLALLTLAIGGPFLAHQEYAARRDAEQATTQAREALDEQRKLLYVTDMMLAMQYLDEGNPSATYQILQRHLPNEDLREFEWFYLWRQCRHAMQIPSVDVYDQVVKMESTNVPKAAEAPGDADLANRSPQARPEQLRGGVVGNLALAPDGNTLAASCGEFVALIDIDEQRVRDVLRPRQWAGEISISPDGQWLRAWYDGLNLIETWNLATLTRIDSQAKAICPVAHDRPWIVTRAEHQEVVGGKQVQRYLAMVIDRQSGKAVATLPGHSGPVVGASFIPGDVSQLFASRCGDGRPYEPSVI